jgi:hypothetical protein
VDFVAVLDQVLALLRQRSRMTYRILQRQFQLDDDALHDLKDELLYAHSEVCDDAGRGLVWTGDAGPAPVAPAAPVEGTPQSMLRGVRWSGASPVSYRPVAAS